MAALVVTRGDGRTADDVSRALPPGSLIGATVSEYVETRRLYAGEFCFFVLLRDVVRQLRGAMTHVGWTENLGLRAPA